MAHNKGDDLQKSVQELFNNFPAIMREEKALAVIIIAIHENDFKIFAPKLPQELIVRTIKSIAHDIDGVVPIEISRETQH